MTAETLMLIGGATAFLLTLYWVRSRDLREKYAAVWMVAAFVLLLGGLFPRAIMIFADQLHLSYPAAVLFLALAAGYVFLFSVSVSLTHQYRQNLRLMQEIALLRYRVQLLEQQQQEKVKGGGASGAAGEQSPTPSKTCPV